MITEDEARAKILASIRPLPGRRVALSAALDCFATRDLAARIALPNFDNSAMDGYAVVANACRKGNRLRVIGEQPAGEDRHLRVASGEAVRIFTGAPIPSGADAIIMQEDVTRHGDEIVANVDVDSGEFIRRRGCDLTEGQQILARRELSIWKSAGKCVPQLFQRATNLSQPAYRFNRVKSTTATRRCWSRSLNVAEPLQNQFNIVLMIVRL